MIIGICDVKKVASCPMKENEQRNDQLDNSNFGSCAWTIPNAVDDSLQSQKPQCFDETNVPE